jgi:thioredoxin-dependent peroxiredoxin
MLVPRRVFRTEELAMTAVATEAMLRIGDTAPDFEAETSQGSVRFHEWMGDSWAVLFSHPKDFTPVCTTELGYMANVKPEFDRRNVKIIGLSVDAIIDHESGRGTSRRRRDRRPTTPSSETRTTRSRSCTGCCPRARMGIPQSERPPTTRRFATST